LGSFLTRCGFVLYVSLNMLVCAVVFLPWVLPRETISGLLGRWLITQGGWKLKFARVAVMIVDRIYFWESNHCVEVYLVEHEARRTLYP
jgi:hypothetical protein